MAALGDGSVVINFINRYLCRDGSYKSLEWRARPSNGVIYAVARDITDRLAHERELNTRRIEAEAANVAKSQFLATISHEVRTPLNAVIGMLELLLRGDLDPTELERATIALDAARGLLSLLNDVLDLSRLDVGKLNIEPAACDAAKLVRDVAALWMTTAEQKGLELALSVSDAVPGRVAIDPLRVRQVITNLVSNALKFTQRGGVTIMLDHTFAEGCGRLVVEVSDTGIGIADADMPKLFSRFSQVDGSLARRHEGVGLGLAVCRQLVELMGGEISVTSAPGRGSSFRFWVPASQAQEEAGRDNSFDDSVDLLPIRLLRILVAEDHPTNQKLIEALLVSMGHEAVIVANGAEAIAAIQQGEFDLVLMDVQMPVMDGVTAVRAIRKLAPPHSGIPVIALTANAMSGDTEKYLVCGMNDYVAKPIERRLLEEAIDRCSVGLVRTLPAEADRVSGRRLAV